MNKQKQYWNSGFEKHATQKPRYDLWLDKYIDVLKQSKDTPIVDLGCGLGGDSLYLSERGYPLISCDISDVAIESVKMNIPGIQTLTFDMLDGLPFTSSSVKVLIADLCIHYFFWKDTVKIVDEIKRVLVPGGYLLSRVNSTKDINYGAGVGVILEEDYYDAGKNNKRFFNKEQIEKLFIGWELKYINEYQLDRFEHPKILWEICCVKNGL